MESNLDQTFRDVVESRIQKNSDNFHLRKRKKYIQYCEILFYLVYILSIYILHLTNQCCDKVDKVDKGHQISRTM